MKNLSNQLVKSLGLIVILILFTGKTSYSQFGGGKNDMADLANKATWTYSTKKVSPNVYDLVFTAKIEPHHHIYSQKTKASLPTEFKFEGAGFELIGTPTEYPKPKKIFEKLMGAWDFYFEGKAVFTQRVKVTSKKPVEINANINYQICFVGGCVPQERDHKFKLAGAVEVPEGSDSGAIAPVVPVDTLQDTTQSLVAQNTDTSKISADKVDGTLEQDIQMNSLWAFFFLAFGFGLLAILTPCVFPMIPMTVSFFMKDSQNKVKARFQALVYGISIILIYTLIGSILAVTMGPDFANFLSTHWIPNILFFLIFIVFAASFFGMFEIVLPSSWVNKADSKVDKGGVFGSVFMALTLVLVSFSCTGPIVGLILVESAGGAVIKPIVGMLGFSLAFALPFTMFAFFPRWLSSMPKSGGWLNSVKVVLGFIELALGLKFLSVADQTYHWGILDREVYLALWIVIFTLMGFYLLGKIKFSHDSDVKHVSVPRLVLVIITFSFVVYLIPGMFGAPLKALSGYLPPQSTHDFDLNKMIRDNASVAMSGEAKASAICDKPKYADFLHLPHGLEGYFDLEQGLKCAKEQNKPVFIDFTGHGCVNCREMEANVWSDPKVLSRLKNDYLVIALYVDDKTSIPEAEWTPANVSADGKVKKSVGKKYADIQIKEFGVISQPYYVLLDSYSDPKNIESQKDMLATPRAYNLNVDAFVEFLDKGKAEFYKRHPKN